MGNNTNRNDHKPKKAWYKRFWVWALVIVIVLSIAAAGGSDTSSPSSSSNASSGSDEKPAKFDLEAAYNAVQTGMSKAQVEEVTGKPSESCTRSEQEDIGSTEMCMYGSAFKDKGVLTVTYMNEEVYSKTKSTY